MPLLSGGCTVTHKEAESKEEAWRKLVLSFVFPLISFGYVTMVLHRVI